MADGNDKPLVAITGCSGLIGSRLTRALSSDYRVAGLDIKPPDASVAGFGWTECDMTDDESVAAALNWVSSQFGNRIASVVHLAAYCDFSGEPSPLYRELTVEGTGRLLRQLQRFDIEQFVFASTLLAMKSSEDDEPLTWPFVFQHGDLTVLWALDFTAALLIIHFALLSYWPPMRHAHLATAGVALALIAFGRIAGGMAPDPAYQNHILVGLLLLMFAIVPNNASQPPKNWYAEKNKA